MTFKLTHFPSLKEVDRDRPSKSVRGNRQGRGSAGRAPNSSDPLAEPLTGILDCSLVSVDRLHLAVEALGPVHDRRHRWSGRPLGSRCVGPSSTSGRTPAPRRRFLSTSSDRRDRRDGNGRSPSVAICQHWCSRLPNLHTISVAGTAPPTKVAMRTPQTLMRWDHCAITARAAAIASAHGTDGQRR